MAQIISDSYLAKILAAVRVDDLEFDEEINGLISTAREELRIAGVKKEKCHDEDDPLILEAVKSYAKANFGLENQDRDAYMKAFEALKLKLVLSAEYVEEG